MTANFCSFANTPNECRILDFTLNLREIRVNIERVILLFTRIIGFIIIIIIIIITYKDALFKNRSK
jgi:hypothetical protein